MNRNKAGEGRGEVVRECLREREQYDPRVQGKKNTVQRRGERGNITELERLVGARSEP